MKRWKKSTSSGSPGCTSGGPKNAQKNLKVDQCPPGTTQEIPDSYRFGLQIVVPPELSGPSEGSPEVHKDVPVARDNGRYGYLRTLPNSGDA